jgi:primosomal protein N' (replication factor Y)
VRVLPDVVRLDKTFDYSVPDVWHADGRAERLAVGSIVRFTLGGRRLRGWVTEVGVDPPAGVKLQPLERLTGMGPPAEVVSLARWAAWRWAGRTVHLLRAASPPRVVTGPMSRRSAHAPDRDSPHRHDDLFEHPGAVTALRCPPSDDGLAVARAAASRGDALIVVPALAHARRIAADLRRRGVRVALGFEDWSQAAAGATVVGTRTAVWMPIPGLAAVVVLDEHSEGLQSEQAPTWHARDVALERARRAGVPAVLVSPVPTLEALETGELKTVGRTAERDGWPAVDVLDRRLDDPVRGGLFAEGLRDRLDRTDGRVAIVLNRKGRGRLLTCKACGELVRTSDGRLPMRLVDDELVAADGSERRPVVCAHCGSTVLRNLRMGVTRAREDLAALIGEPVGELTADSDRLGTERIVVGTEAVLWRLQSAAAVVFLDFDQELLAPRQRAAEQALTLLARGARLTGGRRGEGRLVVQTRQPDHPVVRAAVLADPSIVADIERQRRQELGLPPYGAQAKVSGPGAEIFVAALRGPAGPAVSIRGPLDGQFLLRAPTHELLLELLARTPRPAERLRVEVDPLRV